MKKLLIAAMAASIAMVFAGCGDSADSSSKDSESKKDTTTSATTTTAAETEKNDTETTTSAAAEESSAAPTDDSEAASTGDGSKLFTFTADESKWSTADDALGNTVVTYTGTDIENAAGTCFILINSEEATDLQDYSFEELAPTFQQSMGLGDAFVIDEQKATEFNGYDAYIMSGTFTQSNVKFDLDVILARKDTKLVVVCPMTYSECTEAISGEVQTILDSIQIV